MVRFYMAVGLESSPWDLREFLGLSLVEQALRLLWGSWTGAHRDMIITQIGPAQDAGRSDSPHLDQKGEASKQMKETKG